MNAIFIVDSRTIYNWLFTTLEGWIVTQRTQVMLHDRLLSRERRKKRYNPRLRRRSLQMLFAGLFMTILCSACTLPGNSTTTNLSGHITIAGSTALQPLAAQAATLFQKLHPNVHIEVQGIGSIKGLQEVTSNKINIGTSDIYADPALYPDPNLTDHIVCVIPFAMIVNPDISLPSLTPQQVIDIFSTGIYTNWAQLGGPDIPIVPVVRPSTSGTRDTFRKYVLGGRDERYKPLNTDSSVEVLSRVAKTPGAIGYLALSVANSSVHTIALNQQQPTVNAISNGTYSFWGYEHMYTMGDDNAAINAYLDFMLTPQVQQLAQKLGYIPIGSMKLPSVGSTAAAGSTHLSTDPRTLPMIAHDESEAIRRELL
ncbi:MAG TPA: phosphate ABC transporter substrate-binding protein [Ktedonobacteraceae bacterium]|nr:phosphate ABC transporter substrate-binding protein [Ktedonobacteraceae bacterium]